MRRDSVEIDVDAAATMAALRAERRRAERAGPAVDVERKTALHRANADLPPVDDSLTPAGVSDDLSEEFGVDVVLTFDDTEYLSWIAQELRRLDGFGALDGLRRITDDPDAFEGHVDADLKERASGLYHTGTTELYVAPEEVIGETPRERRTRRGFFSTNSNYGSIWHEIAHHRIREENPGEDFEAGPDEAYWGEEAMDRWAVEEIQGWDWDTSQDPASIREARAARIEYVTDEVSEYANYGGMEFIAEVYAGLMAGHDYPDPIMDLHDRLHGPVPPEDARDPGTDFEVGIEVGAPAAEAIDAAEGTETRAVAGTADLDAVIDEIDDAIRRGDRPSGAANLVSRALNDVTGVFPITLPPFDGDDQLREVAVTFARAGAVGLTRPIEEITALDARRDEKYGVYKYDTDVLGLNDWFPAEALLDHHHDGETVGWNMEWLVLHEIGHGVHDAHLEREGLNPLLKTMSVSEVPGDPSFDEDRTRRRLDAAERKVSNYARSNAGEFVAEVFAGLCLGHSYDDEIMSMYDEYGGPPDWRRYREAFHPDGPERPPVLAQAVDAPGLPEPLRLEAEAVAASARAGPAGPIGPGVPGPAGAIEAQDPAVDRVVRALQRAGFEEVDPTTVGRKEGYVAIDFHVPVLAPGMEKRMTKSSLTLHEGVPDRFTLRFPFTQVTHYDHDEIVDAISVAEERARLPGKIVVQDAPEVHRPHLIDKDVSSVDDPVDLVRKFETVVDTYYGVIEAGGVGDYLDEVDARGGQDDITPVIRDELSEWSMDPCDINLGSCDSFALAVTDRVLGARIVHNLEFAAQHDGPDHVWIEYEGRHYDSEAPEGVDDWRDIPLLRTGFDDDVLADAEVVMGQGGGEVVDDATGGSYYGDVETSIARAAQEGYMTGVRQEIDRAIESRVQAHDGPHPVDYFDTKGAAEERAREIGCKGAHLMPGGGWMPCDTHADYERATGSEAKVTVEDDPLAYPRSRANINDREFQIIMPKTDNSGRPLRPEVVEEFATTIAERFGGVTVFPSVAGCFIPDEGRLSGQLMCEENIVVTTVRDSEDAVSFDADAQWIQDLARVVGRDLGQISVLTSEDVVEVDFVEGDYQEELPADRVGRNVFRDLF